jgi:hypothetical protein
VRVLGTVVLAIGVVVATIVFLLLSSCAFGHNTAPSVRTTYALFALGDFGVIAAGVWAIARLNKNK